MSKTVWILSCKDLNSATCSPTPLAVFSSLILCTQFEKSYRLKYCEKWDISIEDSYDDLSFYLGETTLDPTF